MRDQSSRHVSRAVFHRIIRAGEAYLVLLRSVPPVVAAVAVYNIAMVGVLISDAMTTVPLYGEANKFSVITVTVNTNLPVLIARSLPY